MPERAALPPGRTLSRRCRRSPNSIDYRDQNTINYRDHSHDDRKPITVAILDGDEAGEDALTQIEDEELLPRGTYDTYKGCKVKLEEADTERVSEVLEDFVPVKLLAAGVKEYLKRVWKMSPDDLASVDGKLVVDANKNLAQLLVCVVRELEPRTERVSKVHIKGEVIDIVIDELLCLPAFEAERRQFVDRFEIVLKMLVRQLQAAEKAFRQSNIILHSRILIDAYLKLRRGETTRYYVSTLLGSLASVVGGTSEDARKTREQLAALQELLDDESLLAADPVDAGVWEARLRHLWKCPWKEPKKGWKSIRAEQKSDEV